MTAFMYRLTRLPLFTVPERKKGGGQGMEREREREEQEEVEGAGGSGRSKCKRVNAVSSS